jgi:hypothetical protein
MIAFGAVQKAIHGLGFVYDMDLIDKCLGVLSYCALRDGLAGRFRDRLSGELNGLRQMRASNGRQQDSLMTDDPIFEDILFEFDAGSSDLHLTARRLLNLIHHPFSGLSDIATGDTLSNPAETIMGTHLEWEWELKGSKILDSISEPPLAQGMCAATSEEVQRLMQQPEGAAWCTWTPSMGS